MLVPIIGASAYILGLTAMAGKGDASSWVESFAEYLEPVARATIGMKDQVGGFVFAV